jgi:hypothetical protein
VASAGCYCVLCEPEERMGGKRKKEKKKEKERGEKRE